MQLLKKLSKLTPYRTLFQLLIIMVATFVLIPQFREFIDSPLQLSQIDAYWIVVTVAGVTASYVAAVGVYVSLLSPKLRWPPTLVAQLATSFTNRLLPAGIGGMGTYVRYLHKQKIPASKSAVAVGANQLIGVFSFVLLVAALGLSANKNQITLSFSTRTFGYVGLFVVVLGILTPVLRLMLPSVGNKLTHSTAQLWQSVVQLSVQPKKTLQALGWTLAITACYAVALYAALRSVGVSLTPRDVLFVYMGSSIASSIAPTPGGLGPVEAALVAGLGTVGVAPSQAVSGVLIYRTVSFWLPILPGFFAFRWLLHNKQV